MTVRQYSHIDACRAELEKHGETDIAVDPSHRHPRVYYTWKGKRQFYVTSATPSDTMRGEFNIRSDIRRLLGVVGEKKHKRPPRQREELPKRLTTPVKMPAQISVGHDGFANLIHHKLYRGNT